MKNYFIAPKEKGILALFLNFMKPLVELENKWLCHKGWKGLLLARIVSIISLFLVLYTTHFLFIYFGTYIGGYFTETTQTSHAYWWTIPTILGLPLGILLVLNAKNRNYVLSEKIVNTLEIFNYSTKNTIKSFQARLVLEVTGLLLFGLFYSTALFMSMSNFIDEITLSNWLSNKPTFFLLTMISVVIYMTIRILLLEDTTPTQKFIKNRRLFCLWLAAGIITLGFIIGDLYDVKEKYPTEFFYAGIVLLLAIDKIIDSYQKVRTVIHEIKN